MDKVVGFYDTCFFNVQAINDGSGIITFNEDTKEKQYLSHRELKKKRKKICKQK